MHTQLLGPQLVARLRAHHNTSQMVEGKADLRCVLIYNIHNILDGYIDG